MKIKIGPYLTWWGPYQIIEKLMFWVDQNTEEGKDRVHAVGEKLASTWVAKACEWVHEKRKRTENICIDKYDTWSMDSTLSMIILPMLIQLKATKHGAPFVDDEDVPDELKSTAALPKENEWDTDSNHFKRWDWVLDEMIWAFTQINDPESESQFHHGVIEFESVPCENGLHELVRGKNDTSTFDKEGYMVHQARVDRGTTLFGRYFRALWD